jgi:divalent metal cation (Fe/Co/Zn/Cd) transporter
VAGLVLYDVLGWWWADRVAALVVAAIAAALAWAHRAALAMTQGWVSG